MGGWNLAHLQPEGDVPKDVHVQYEGNEHTLEDGIDGSVVGWGLPPQFAAQVDLSHHGQFKTGNEAQGRGLPHPEGPNSEKNSPSRMESEMSSTATTRPKCLLTSFKSTAYSDMNSAEKLIAEETS